MAYTLTDVGFSPDNLAVVRSSLAQRRGLIVVAGSSDGGKTTTLQAMLAAIRSSARPGAAEPVRVVVHDEIEDATAARTLTEAADTLVLAAIRADDAVAVLRWFLAHGIRPSAIPSLTTIVAQRLVRSPCTACAVIQVPRSTTLEALRLTGGLPDGRWLAGLGCDQCGHSGFAGRTPIHEVLLMTSEMAGKISAGAADAVLRAAMAGSGMRTLRDDGIAKAAQGLTTLEEVERVTRAVPAAAPADDVAVVTGAGASPSPEQPTGSRRVLIVEDNPTTTVVVRYFMELDGFEVLAATDGEEGLALALARQPDVIITDLNMPGLNGVDLIRRLRADARTAGARILILTAESSADSETSLLAAGADDYLVKPVEPKILAARVNALLQRP